MSMHHTSTVERAPLASSHEHDEWVIDESLEETFPASDPTSPVRPGSIVGMRNADAQRAGRRMRSMDRVMSTLKSSAPWLIGAAAVWLAFGRKR